MTSVAGEGTVAKLREPKRLVIVSHVLHYEHGAGSTIIVTTEEYYRAMHDMMGALLDAGDLTVVKNQSGIIIPGANGGG